MKHSIQILFLLLPLLISCGITKDISKSERRELYRQIRTNMPSLTGIALKELGKEALLIDYNADQLFTPASNIKLLTLYSGKELVGDSLPLFEYIKSGNTLHIRGIGNPVLLHPEFEYLNKGWIDQIIHWSVDSIVIHQREMANGRFGPGWAWDDYPYSFQTEIHSLPLFGNSLWVSWNTEKDLLEMYPDHIAKYADVKVNKGSSKLNIQREEFSNSFIINAGTKVGSKMAISVPFLMDIYTASQILQDTLPIDIQYSYAKPEGIWQAFSYIPLDSAYRKMMAHSDNFLAEQILLASSYKLGDTLDSEKAIRFILTEHFPEYRDKISWVDASGLSRYNLLPPVFNLRVLEKLFGQITEEKIEYYFPKLGAEGTVKKGYEYLHNYNIHGKSGSLKHHYTLSGYFHTKDDRIILYSIMLDNTLEDKGKIKREVSSLLQSIYESL